jgi:hypothetical protein
VPPTVGGPVPEHNRPHVIRHLFGLDVFTHGRERREERRLSQHAAIAYGQKDQSLTELPASMVYSRR